MRRHLILASSFSLAFLAGIVPAFGQAVKTNGGSGHTEIPKEARAGHSARKAPLFSGLGNYQKTISTKVPMAQRYFNQGLTLAYAFNHAEAIRSFQEAARLDPDCAMAYWGMAFASGPNINAAMDKGAVPEAYTAVQKALALSVKVSEKERAFITALAKRYADKPVEDRKPLDKAFADAMQEVAAKYPDDPDALTIFAEATMDTMPWSYWTKDGKPNTGTMDAIAAIEKALTLSPEHPGANHFYIHITEASPTPERGMAAAYRLRDLTPTAGHLVHMPAHTFIRTGMYHEAALANERAILADDSYITQCRMQGLYPVIYMPHNHHFLWAATTLEGRSEKAIASARRMALHSDTKRMREPGMSTHQHFWITPLYALVRFGKWDDILAELEPDKDLLYPSGVWRYARSLAFLRKGMMDSASKELFELTKITENAALESQTISDLNPMVAVLKLAAEILRGEIAATNKDYSKAISYLENAVQMEEALNYDEPSAWHHPTRQILGAVLLEAGRIAEAEKVYDEDLKRLPANGWSLYGLLQCALKRGDSKKADDLQKRFQEAWQHADIALPASRF